MKLLVFLIFAGCAVKCDESGNYYVIERPSDSPVRELRPFQVYWNVPTFQCKSKKIVFEHLFEKYGIIQNQNDTFQGEKIAILYDPGLFPAILQEESSGRLRTRNGGVPQEGNLDEHLTAFRFVLDQSIPDPQFSGIGVIDFESWRPVFRQNSWGVLTPYRNLSLLIERRLHPWWTKGMIEREAKYRFERAGREFMQGTLALARLLRPRAKWGYYGFPYCFNMAGTKPAEACSSIIQKENDQISWLWAESTALFPSLYSAAGRDAAQLAARVRGRAAEAARVGRGAPVLPYFWFKYRDAGFMSQVDLKAALKAMYKSHTSGFILWGSSNDVNSISKCEKLKNYLEQVLGPEIAKYTKQAYKIDESYNVSNDSKYNVTTQNPFYLTTDSNDDDNIHTTNSEEANENSPEIIQKLDDEMMSSTNDTGKVRVGKNVLLDIVLSLIENIQKQYNKEEYETTMKKIAKDRKKGTPIHDTFTTSRDDDSELTTKNPLNDFRKKALLFALIYQTKNATKRNKTTYTTEESSTTDHDFRSTTADLLYDYENYTSTHNQTIFNEDFNYNISESNIDANTVSYKGEETTSSIFFENELNFTTSTESTTVKIPNAIDETTIPIFFDNDDIFSNNTTEILYDESSTSETYTTTEESTTESYAHTADVKGSTTNELLSVTVATTSQDTDAVPESVYDDPEYQVVIAAID